MKSGILRSGPNSSASILAPKWDTEKDEITFASIGPGGSFEYNIQLAFFLAFGDVEGLAGRPVIDTLNGTAAEVERIIRAVGGESQRIGLFI